jgi:hypothetical protein
MNRDQYRLEVNGSGLPRLGCNLGPYEFRLRHGGNFHLEEGFHFAKPANVARQMEAQVPSQASAQEDVIAQIVDAQLQIAEPKHRLVAPEVGTVQGIRSAQSKNRDLGHRQ